MARDTQEPCDECPQLEEPFRLWKENERTASLFVLSLTQMRRTDMVVFGLDYNALALVASWHGIEITAALHQKIRVCELEYCRLSNERVSDGNGNSQD